MRLHREAERHIGPTPHPIWKLVRGFTEVDGTWSQTLIGLSDGETVSVVATATDPAGNTAASAPFNFTVDTDAGEQTALKLSLVETTIHGSVVHFVANGLEADETAVITFTSSDQDD